ncbi:MAG TPA: aminotransferase class IV [Candidatus Acidoferrales bacterium]|nr:aminotransferase class IV [Candidatus Acidoferrales bacterium]
MLVFLNCKFVPEEKAVVSVFDRAFLYGDGLFETMRIANGRPFRWEQHMQRLQQGARFLRIKLPLPPAKLHAFAIKLAAKNKACNTLLRLTLSRGVGTPGYSPKNAKTATIVMSLRPLPKIGQGKVTQWRLVTSSFRLPAGDPLAAFKTCNKLAQVMARAEADAAGADEALLSNTDGFIVEGASSNLFWLRRGVLFTPPLAAGILPGVTRTVLMEIASRLKVSVREKNIRLKDLLQSDGAFLSLSSFGVVEAKSLDGHVLKRSPLTAQIARAYETMLLNSSACNLRPEP